MTEQFEQAKREIAEKWGYTISVNKKGELYNANCKRKLNNDLTALLEQHKEMILREELTAYDTWLQTHKWRTSDMDTPTQAVNKYFESRKDSK